jgi:hypothetical protein
MMGNAIKFRPATFYLEIADWLAKEVEGQQRHIEETGIESDANQAKL